MKKRIGVTGTLRYCLLFIVMFWIIFPFLWFALLSIKPHKLAFSTTPEFFFRPSFGSYVATFFTSDTLFPRYLLNSFIIASANVFLCLALGLPAAYSFARFKYKGRGQLFIGFLLVRMLPPAVIIIPIYMIAYHLHILAMHITQILAFLIYNLPFVIWMMKGFFEEIPKELDEAAMIDGCSGLAAFRKIVLPLAAPGFAVTSLLSFVFCWNEFMWASVLTAGDVQTMPVAIASFWTNKLLDWSRIAATTNIFLMPPILISLLLRKYLVKGLTFGAIKM